MTGPLYDVLTLPSASSIDATTEKPAPTITLDGGCDVTTSLSWILNVEETTEVRPEAVAWSVSPTPGALMVTPVNVATPLTAVAVSVPPNVAPPGLAASASVTLPVKLVARLPAASSASTVNLIGAPTRYGPPGAVTTS